MTFFGNVKLAVDQQAMDDAGKLHIDVNGVMTWHANETKMEWAWREIVMHAVLSASETHAQRVWFQLANGGEVVLDSDEHVSEIYDLMCEAAALHPDEEEDESGAVAADSDTPAPIDWDSLLQVPAEFEPVPNEEELKRKFENAEEER